MSIKIIQAGNTSIFPDFKELYRYKDLFLTLSWRDFRVRYAQTTIGFLWALLQPIVTLLILTLVFNKFAGVETEVPHIVFTVCGLSMWSYFSYVMTNSGSSIIQSQDMVKKIYFPRLIIPLSKALVGLIDFGITILILIVLMIYYQVAPAKTIFFAPIFVIIGMISALAVGIWLSALTVRFRDFQHVVPFMVQVGLYLTPVAYPIELVSQHLPKWAESIYYLNPMAGVIQGFRWSIFGGTPPSSMIFISFAMVILLLISGLMYFKKVESEMADYV
jgi:lipopolysaccharide transport system permease protein|tara:strand:- start:4269 stop:5093 length:825 start_codon:yes stop_codon:yes gene_type:complete